MICSSNSSKPCTSCSHVKDHTNRVLPLSPEHTSKDIHDLAEEKGELPQASLAVQPCPTDNTQSPHTFPKRHVSAAPGDQLKHVGGSLFTGPLGRTGLLSQYLKRSHP